MIYSTLIDYIILLRYIQEEKLDIDSININKKIIPGIVVEVITSILLISRHNPGSLVLFLLGVGVGIFIGISARDYFSAWEWGRIREISKGTF